MDFLYQYGLFLAQTLTLVGAVLVVAGYLAALGMRHKASEDGHLQLASLNEQFEDLQDAMQGRLLDQKQYKKWRKQHDKARQQQRREADKAGTARPRVFVLRFTGDVEASGVGALAREISAILAVAERGDTVLACVESPGGLVHAYGLAASQLLRLRDGGLELIVAIDRVAASGGYMMACVGSRILAAPFAIVGSIGVVAELPNVNRLLRRNDVDYEIFTAGEYKRTVSVFGENTEAGKAKFREELDDVHVLFKEFVAEWRPSLDLERIATGEAWHGRRALALGLVDELRTSDAWLFERRDSHELVDVRWQPNQSPLERLMARSGLAALPRGLRALLGPFWPSRATGGMRSTAQPATTTTPNIDTISAEQQP